MYAKSSLLWADHSLINIPNVIDYLLELTQYNNIYMG